MCQRKLSISKEYLMKTSLKLFSLLIAFSILVSACSTASKAGGESNSTANDSATGRLVEYGLETAMLDGQMAFIGVGGGIDGVKNPTLSANVGDTVKITLTAGDSVEHDVAFPDFNAQSEHIAGEGKTSSFEFVADK